jgi:hypothetical protein
MSKKKMHLKKNDFVKLLPGWALDSSVTSPIWGGPYGYKLGRVLKTVTGEHDRTKHVAIVEWSSGSKVSYPEAALSVADASERSVALDADSPTGPCLKDIWVLIKTSAGNFGLSVVECFPCGLRERGVKYSSVVSQQVLPTIDNSDYNLIATFMSHGDYTETKTQSLFTAAQHIFAIWGLPELKDLPLPLPEFPTLREAAAYAPKDGPGVLFFHLPKSMMDYSDAPPAF